MISTVGFAVMCASFVLRVSAWHTDPAQKASVDVLHVRLKWAVRYTALTIVWLRSYTAEWLRVLTVWLRSELPKRKLYRRVRAGRVYPTVARIAAFLQGCAWRAFTALASALRSLYTIRFPMFTPERYVRTRAVTTKDSGSLRHFTLI